MTRLAFWSIQCAWALVNSNLPLRKIPFHKYEYYEQIHDKPVVLQQEVQTGMVVTACYPRKTGKWFSCSEIFWSQWDDTRSRTKKFVCVCVCLGSFPKEAAKLDGFSRIGTSNWYCDVWCALTSKFCPLWWTLAFFGLSVLSMSSFRLPPCSYDLQGCPYSGQCLIMPRWTLRRTV